MRNAAILLLLTAMTPVAARCPASAADRAKATLQIADKAAARGDHRGANTALDAALRLLGDTYASPPTIDDTGMHLVLAESRQRQGKPKQAAALKRRILVERLALCGRPADARGAGGR